MRDIKSITEKYLKEESFNVYESGFARELDGTRLGSWTLDVEEHSGGFGWMRKGFEWAVYATPYWEDEDGVGVAVTDEDGNYIEGKDINYLKQVLDSDGLIKGLKFTGNNKIDKKNYLDKMVKVLDLVYKNQGRFVKKV